MAQDDFPWNVNAEESSRRVRVNLNAREHELDEIRRNLAEREALIDQRMQQEKEMLAAREREFHEAMEKRTQNLFHHEQSIAKRQEQLELERREEQKASEKWRSSFLIQQRELQETRLTLDLEKQRLTEEGQKALQRNSKKFVGSALTFLSDKEGRFHLISCVWAVVGALALLAGVVIAVMTMVSSSDLYHQAAGAGLGYYFFHLFRGLVVVGLCGVLSRYAFVFSKSYMHESLKIGERAHAIRFGEFYLDIYGANAEWDQVKEAFAHWNINGESAFSSADAPPPKIDVTGAAAKLVDKAIDIASTMGSKPDK
jgi:hypothetical protein